LQFEPVAPPIVALITFAGVVSVRIATLQPSGSGSVMLQ
jgi:hypothetical protein